MRPRDARLFPLDILSRLKGIETLCYLVRQSLDDPPLDILSRLKGIETRVDLGQFATEKAPFGYTFPFEGN